MMYEELSMNELDLVSGGCAKESVIHKKVMRGAGANDRKHGTINIVKYLFCQSYRVGWQTGRR